MIIDSKVSLLAWEQYVSESDIVNQKTSLEAHIKSLKIHIDGLSKKEFIISKFSVFMIIFYHFF